MFTSRFQRWVRDHAHAVASALARLGLTPNQVTVVGMLISFGAGALIALGQLLPGGLVLALGGIFDVFDGALARVTGRGSDYGAFVDSTLDRYSEAAVLVGIAVYFAARPDGRLGVLFTLVALVGSFLVSYARARAQSLGFTCEGGLFARPERVVVTVAGLVLGPTVLLWVMGLLAILTNVTAAQRIAGVYRQTRGPAPQPKREAVARPGKPATHPRL